MQTTTLGRSGLNVSVACLGCGGHSRLGMRRGASEAEAADLVRAAVDLGVTIVDTAAVYGTEAAVGAGLEGVRDGVVVSSKARCNRPGSAADSLDLVGAEDVRRSVEKSLATLRTDRIDVLHLHGVRPAQFDHCAAELVPELHRLRDEGKIRFLGITEGFGADREHETMRRAIASGLFDVVMLGYNFVNPSAAVFVLPEAEAADVGVMCMYAVRGMLAAPETLQALVQRLVDDGEVDADALDGAAPAGVLLASGVAGSLTEAAYRFCRHTPGIDVVMTGTGSLDHLRQNLRDIDGPPLPQDVLRSLAKTFGRVRTATGDPLGHRPG